VKRGLIERDVAQENALAAMDEVRLRLCDNQTWWSSAVSFFAGPKLCGHRGLYIYGPPGSGKTMLLRLLFESVPIKAKRWAHIHEFVADLHSRIHGSQHQSAVGASDAIAVAVRSLARDTMLLSLDEIALLDVADAALLGRVLAGLISAGVFIAMTSNAAPDRLYEEQANRAPFRPFVELLQHRVYTIRVESRADFRYEKPKASNVWFAPAATSGAKLDATFRRLTGGAPMEAVTFRVQGHSLRVPRHARGVGRFRFEELCLSHLGASDYLAIAENLHAVIIEAIPRRFAHRNHARRFCMLIDILYDHHVKLFASAETAPGSLLAGLACVLNPAIGPAPPLSHSGPEMLEFRRAVSRLMEMCSDGYVCSALGSRSEAGRPVEPADARSGSGSVQVSGDRC
jgi:cell division protein ZapE